MQRKIIIRRENGKIQGLIGGEGVHNEGIKREILEKRGEEHRARRTRLATVTLTASPTTSRNWQSFSQIDTTKRLHHHSHHVTIPRLTQPTHRSVTAYCPQPCQMLQETPTTSSDTHHCGWMSYLDQSQQRKPFSHPSAKLDISLRMTTKSPSIS